MGNTFSNPTCSWCGNERRRQATGRPGEYCSTRCRQAAHRHRQAATDPPDTLQFDQTLRVQLNQIAHKARDILLALDQPGTSLTAPLEQMVRLQVLTEHLTPHMVARSKQRGASWEQIGALLGMSKDSARKKWSLPARRSPVPQRPAPAAPPAHPRPTRQTRTSLDSGDSPDCPPPPAQPGTTATLAGQDLATVLSSLQRASGLSLRALATRTGLSPSYLSRLMSGERFPAWKYAAALARACGADPEVMRRVWEASNARRDNQPAPASLASALRFLHLRAGSPTPWAIAISSGGTLNQDHVTALLDGTSTGEWDHVRRLIQLLDGEPSYFLPLWETETPTTPETPQPPPTREDPPTASTRVEELLTAFKSALGPPRLTPTRRCLATPIPGATHWNGR
ncbi:helix-turn-helix domain-containing protein [Streptomyces sp. HUAS TT20]|uniref:helix-turn-helix domain-containing protein n=1 Tax=Streptomyces sp. HUAS TT20 TaxID=3447509 RepID=UPI0021DAF361|nr:helix-turn-helix transcriptional regulator [Streptomyces sp. HUAS 15-9]UXY25136.1 helix-turn-helix domain-containing protein [Streptomyces sp. HUAS 15-9]